MKNLAAISLLFGLLNLPELASAQTPDDEATLYDGCKWTEQAVDLASTPPLELSFRWQACDGKQAPKVTFTLDRNNTLIQAWDGNKIPVAQFWPVSGKKPFSLVDAVASPSIAEDERNRCQVRLDYVTRRYSYEPTAAYMEELLARDEPFHACGTFGATNDGIQYFKVIDGKVLAYFWVGQEAPLYDPASFTLVPQAGQQ
ncbi:MAG: hypothetical protein JNM20_19865 [Rhizobiales bacterium]|nr:hypothetical protein [Hyphomicrobiales bacterium]